MAVIESITFETWSGRSKTVRFVSQEPSADGFTTTIITGQNGSHKSTLLREVVAALALPGKGSSVQLLQDDGTPVHVVCISGSVADRFPSKELPGGGKSDFDVPSYVYLGQRVGTNLLSKKRPLETMLTSILDDTKAHRCSWDFFEHAHELACIKPHVEFELLPKRGNSKEPRLDILRTVQATAQSQRPERSKPHRDMHVSEATANWLLDEFHLGDFTELEQLLEKGRKKSRVTVGSNGATSSTVSTSALRLGLLTDLLALSDARVRSRSNASEFSAFELSSGEYHMYSSILGLGFGMSESSVVLIDEPENSLHPQWQQEFMDSIFRVCAQTLTQGHVVVCTHSPLIVSAAVQGSTIVDLTDETSSVERVSVGASSDEVLLTQFGIGSSRNRFVVDIVQRAVSLVERGDFDHPAFEVLKPQLASIRQTLRSGDPLVEVIDALPEEEPK